MDWDESQRQLTRMGFVFLAFLLRFLSAPWAFFVVFALLVHNALLLPRYSPSLFRPGERGLGGVILYPLMLCGLVLAFPDRLEIVAGAWALLAVGDGLATLVGRKHPIASLPWNPGKSLGGLAAFVVAGAIACTVLVVWTAPETGETGWILLTVAVCALIAGLVETFLVPIDDNISVPLSAGFSLSLLLSTQIQSGGSPLTAGTLVFALFLNIILAAVACRLELVNMNGAWAAAVTGSLIFVLGGPGAFAILLLFMVVESGLLRTRFHEQPAAHRTVQRGSKHILTICGVALLAAFLLGTTDGADKYLGLIYVAALATALADRIAIDLAPVLGPPLAKWIGPATVSVGRADVLSTEGTLLGTFGALILAVCGAIVGLCSASMVPVVAAAAVLGGWAKWSMLGLARERDLVLDEEWLRFVVTFAGAFSAAVAAFLLEGWGMVYVL